MLIDAIKDIYEFALGLIMVIPPDNALSQLYIVINTAVLILLALMGGVARGVTSFF